MAKMYVMCGKCGSGKSVFAKKFAKENNIRYLGIDECYGILNGDERIRENKFEAWQLLYKLIHNSFKLDQDVIVDVNAPLKYDRVELLNWFWEFKEHYLIWVDADDELCWANNCKRERHIPRKHFDELNKMFEPPTANEPSCRAKWNEIIYVVNKMNEFKGFGVIEK